MGKVRMKQTTDCIKDFGAYNIGTTPEAKPLLIRRSPMTRRWYAFRSYRPKGAGVEVTGQKWDVTDEVEAIIAWAKSQ